MTFPPLMFLYCVGGRETQERSVHILTVIYFVFIWIQHLFRAKMKRIILSAEGWW